MQRDFGNGSDRGVEVLLPDSQVVRIGEKRLHHRFVGELDHEQPVDGFAGFRPEHLGDPEIVAEAPAD